MDPVQPDPIPPHVVRCLFYMLWICLPYADPIQRVPTPRSSAKRKVSMSCAYVNYMLTIQRGPTPPGSDREETPSPTVGMYFTYVLHMLC